MSTILPVTTKLNNGKVTNVIVADFLSDNIIASAVSDWYIDSTAAAGGNGLTPGTAFQTFEQFSQALCPGGTKCILLNLTTTVHATGVAYVEMYLNISWPAAVTAYGAILTVIGTVTSSAPITLTAVTNTNQATAVSGQLTRAAGAWTDKGRITSVSGANIGARCYSCGQNASAQNHFVGPWVNYDTGSLVTIANSTNVTTDVVNTSIKRVVITISGNGYVEITDINITEGLTLNDYSATGGAPLYIRGGTVTGEWRGTGLISIWNSAIIGFLYYEGPSRMLLYGCSLQGTLYAYAFAGIRFSAGNLVDGGHLIEFGNCYVRSIDAGGVQWMRGTGTAITINAGSNLQVSSPSSFWGPAATAVYPVAVIIDSGAWLYLTSAAAMAIVSTVNYQITGHNIAYAGIPLGYPRANCGVALQPDAAAAAVTV